MAKAKHKTIWNCTECGAESPKWVGRCPSCGAWNTLVENRVSTSTKAITSRDASMTKSVPRAVSEITAGDESRITMPSHELNRVLGG